jgi:predicted DNA binding CopG/RHH family protein
MKYFELDKEEKELLEEFERGEWVPVKNQAKARREAIEAARNTLNKLRNINIRLSERDLQKLKAKAVENGIPYQTLASSVLHRFAKKSEIPD